MSRSSSPEIEIIKEVAPKRRHGYPTQATTSTAPTSGRAGERPQHATSIAARPYPPPTQRYNRQQQQQPRNMPPHQQVGGAMPINASELANRMRAAAALQYIPGETEGGRVTVQHNQQLHTQRVWEAEARQSVNQAQARSVSRNTRGLDPMGPVAHADVVSVVPLSLDNIYGAAPVPQLAAGVISSGAALQQQQAAMGMYRQSPVDVIPPDPQNARPRPQMTTHQLSQQQPGSFRQAVLSQQNRRTPVHAGSVPQPLIKPVSSGGYQPRAQRPPAQLLPKQHNIQQQPIGPRPFSMYYGRSHAFLNDILMEQDHFDGKIQCRWKDVNNKECKETFSTNISFSHHVTAHFAMEHTINMKNQHDSMRGESDDAVDVLVEDYCQCQKCFLVLKSPYIAQAHMRLIHARTPLPDDKGTPCYICERLFRTESDVHGHMITKHRGRHDVPYKCPVVRCSFRSSLYDDVMFHFEQSHRFTRTIFCGLCLRAFDVEMKRRANYGNTLIKHMLQHLERLEDKVKCGQCKLVFTSQKEQVFHVNTCHLQGGNLSGIVPIRCDGPHPMQLSQEITGKLNRPSRRLLHIELDDKTTPKTTTIDHASCIECRHRMDLAQHYTKTRSFKCIQCRYRTMCSFAFDKHIQTHSEQYDKNTVVVELPGERMIKCECGFTTNIGNDMAEHMTQCEPSWTYGAKLQPKEKKSSKTEQQTESTATALDPRFEFITNGGTVPLDLACMLDASMMGARFPENSGITMPQVDKNTTPDVIYGHPSPIDKTTEHHRPSHLSIDVNAKSPTPEPSPTSAEATVTHHGSLLQSCHRRHGSMMSPNKSVNVSRKRSDSQREQGRETPPGVKIQRTIRKNKRGPGAEGSSLFLSRHATADNAGRRYAKYREMVHHWDNTEIGRQSDLLFRMNRQLTVTSKPTSTTDDEWHSDLVDDIMLQVTVSRVLEGIIKEVDNLVPVAAPPMPAERELPVSTETSPFSDGESGADQDVEEQMDDDEIVQEVLEKQKINERENDDDNAMDLDTFLAELG